jgi:thiamine-monophosphate kinase
MTKVNDRTLSSRGEFGMIAMLAGKTPKLINSVYGIGDDTAVLKISSGRDLLLTTDMLIENVHFSLNMDMKAVGRKSLCCSISDIAAMGGVPLHAVVSLGAPSSTKCSVIDRIYEGIFKAAREYEVDIVGGDTVKSRNMVINVALTGEVEKGKAVYRHGARPGDHIFVTGPLGNSLKSGWHLNFKPRIKESRYLMSYFKPTAMIDISDGLAGDLGHIMQKSSVSAIVCGANVPLRKGAKLENAFSDGEDFELLFTLAPNDGNRLMKKNKFHFIGRIVESGQGLLCEMPDGRIKRVEPKSFRHF